MPSGQSIVSEPGRFFDRVDHSSSVPDDSSAVETTAFWIERARLVFARIAVANQVIRVPASLTEPPDLRVQLSLML